MASAAGTVLSVNVGRPREFEYKGRPAKSAIWKSPVAGRIAVRGVNLVGDDQAGKVRLGQDATTTCTLTFLAPWTNGAVCTAVNETNGGGFSMPVGKRGSSMRISSRQAETEIPKPACNSMNNEPDAQACGAHDTG